MAVMCGDAINLGISTVVQKECELFKGLKKVSAEEGDASEGLLLFLWNVPPVYGGRGNP